MPGNTQVTLPAQHGSYNMAPTKSVFADDCLLFFFQMAAFNAVLMMRAMHKNFDKVNQMCSMRETLPKDIVSIV